MLRRNVSDGFLHQTGDVSRTSTPRGFWIQGSWSLLFFPKGLQPTQTHPSRVFSHLPLASFSSVSVLERCLIRGRVGARAWRGETRGEDSEDQPGAGGWEWVGHVDPKACTSLLPWPDLDSCLLPVSSQGPPLYLSMSQFPLLFLLLFFWSCHSARGNLNSPTRDQTHIPCIGSVDHQRSPLPFL